MQKLRLLARRRITSCIVAAILIFVVRIAMLPWHRVPTPSVHDEFSYLLAADTFAHGHLANPAHPLWPFFESFHVISTPVYVSKYPPLQGMVLAVGELAGQPWIGVLLSTSLMVGLLCWTLQGWLSPGWALLGALAAGLRFGISGYWMDSYWGGSVTAIGGCLILGALPRLVRRPRAWRLGVVWALGASVLLNTRPFEGVLIIGLSAALLLWKRQTRWLLPASCLLVPALALMAVYNERVTGSPWKLPYMMHEEQYAVASAFWPLPPRAAPVYRHDELRRFWTDDDYKPWATARAYPGVTWLFYFRRIADFYFGSVVLLVLPFIALLRRPTKRVRLAAMLLGGFLLLTMLERAPYPHYVAPAAPLFVLLTIAGLRATWRWTAFGRVGVVVVIAFWMLLAILPKLSPAYGVYENPEFGLERVAIEKQLDAEAGRQLVFVHYRPGHKVHHEWVNNGADLENAKILWARDMGTAENEKLIRYCAGRNVWWLDADAGGRVAISKTMLP